jgi:hypothetical protein
VAVAAALVAKAGRLGVARAVVVVRRTRRAAIGHQEGAVIAAEHGRDFRRQGPAHGVEPARVAERAPARDDLAGVLADPGAVGRGVGGALEPVLRARGVAAGALQLGQQR